MKDFKLEKTERTHPLTKVLGITLFTLVLLVSNAAAPIPGLNSNSSASPTVYVTATPNHGSTPLVVGFTSKIITSAATGPVVLYMWNFGGGYTSSLSSATHTYLSPGSYGASLTVFTSKGGVGIGGSGPITVTGKDMSGSGSVYGTIYKSDVKTQLVLNNQAAGNYVALSPAVGSDVKANTNGNGYYKFNLRTGMYSISAFYHNDIIGDSGTTFLLSPNQNLEKDITTKDFAGSVSGTVYYSDGITPIGLNNIKAGNYINLVDVNGENHQAQTTSSGAFIFNDIPVGKFTITAKVDNNPVGQSIGQVNFNSKTAVLLKTSVQAMGSIAGTVYFSDKATPFVINDYSPNNYLHLDSHDYEYSVDFDTDSYGHYSLNDVPDGSYTLYADYGNKQVGIKTFSIAPFKNNVENLSTSVPRQPQVSGTIHYADGTPVIVDSQECKFQLYLD